MVLSDFKYLFTIIGGGWTFVHEFWGISKDNRVFFSTNVKSLDVSTLEYKFTLNGDLDFELHNNNVGFDAPTCSMYKVHEGETSLLYSVGMYNNTPAVDIVKSIYNQECRGKHSSQPKESGKDNTSNEGFVIGEVSGSNVKSLLMNIGTGHKCTTTYHASNEPVKNLQELFRNTKVPDIDLYIGVSGAGKTYQLKHKVLDLVSINSSVNNQYKIYVVGRMDEWSMISGIELIDAKTFKPDMLNRILWIQNSILVLDSIETYTSDEFKLILSNLLTNFGGNFTSVILFCHSYEQIPSELIRRLHSAYIGKLFRHDLIPLCRNLGIDFMDYELECLKFKKVELGGRFEDE